MVSLLPKNNSHSGMPPSEKRTESHFRKKQTKTGRKTQDSQQKKTFMDQNSKALELSHNLEKKSGSLVLVSCFVKKNRGAIIHPPDNEVMKDIKIRICGLDGTMYSGEQHTLKTWEGLYLPKPTKMEVLGILESLDSIASFPQWIILVGEDGRVYGYEDEVLFLHANSLKELLRDGIKTDTYYDYPDDISDEQAFCVFIAGRGKLCHRWEGEAGAELRGHCWKKEEEVLQQDENIKKLREDTKKFIDDDGEEFNEFLDFYFESELAARQECKTS